MNKSILKITVVGLALLVASCGTKKAVVGSSVPKTPAVARGEGSTALQELAFVQMVSDRQLYQKNIVADMSFNIRAGSKNITVPGSVHMRKDEVVRLQLFIPLLGSEVGRLEFTPDYVLVVDRMHKEYIKADYTQLDFLKENGLNFYSLQALFWNQLLLPGNQKVGEADLQQFDADLAKQGPIVPVSLKNGKMTFLWNADKNDGRILSTVVEYLSTAHGKSSLTWKYSNFQPVGVKLFPASQEFTFTTNAGGKPQTGKVTIDMDAIRTNDDWDSQSSVSPKYKRVEAKDVFDKILKM
ncbi:DUF4292 domain-containing protein [Prevotella sp. KH2C16]|uniref:DUF4292 domain-containing protein n=1 Tax=Prevotella sp. KH2C16 TaxID=1855325 RepID=UPI0008F22F2A|nr:DUF4292 domain-containing protein [Prevotella sp. KH2C16]SFG05087.1 protein of unknown function [Prevotella sp. KH2C16]